jgi:hypothetical protein
MFETWNSFGALAMAVPPNKTKLAQSKATAPKNLSDIINLHHFLNAALLLIARGLIIFGRIRPLRRLRAPPKRGAWHRA